MPQLHSVSKVLLLRLSPFSCRCHKGTTIEACHNVGHHPLELKSKSTAIHAKILSPETVNIYPSTGFPDYAADPDGVLLLFPSKNAKSINDIDLSKCTRVVVIDCTWNQVNAIVKDPKLQGLQTVKLQAHKTTFWRYQFKSDEFLATIEAIYYLYRELWTATHEGSYRGELDDLLFFYAYFYKMIQKRYKDRKQVFPRKEGYVQLSSVNKENEREQSH